MAEQHWSFIAIAYGLSALAIVAELVGLAHRRRQALARVARERELEHGDEASARDDGPEPLGADGDGPTHRYEHEA